MSKFFSTPFAAPSASVVRRLPHLRLGTNGLLLAVALYLSLTQNLAFWHQVLMVLPKIHGGLDYAMLARLFVTLNVLLLLVMAPLSARVMLKPALMLILVSASVCSYFMDAYGTVIDEAMIANALQSDARETGELLGSNMLLHIFFQGLLPAFIVLRTNLTRGTAFSELGRRVLLVALALALLLTAVLSNYKHVSLWGRSNRHIRMYVNPTYPLHSAYRHFKANFKTPDAPLIPIAEDAVRQPSASGKPRVVVMVVGETARAANFQLAGYARETNPELSKINKLVSFRQVSSCGTATAMSVPCMFSRLGRHDFSRAKGRAEENVLDVLQKTGVSVLWRDNNSDSKGVAERVQTQDLRHLKLPEFCSAEECMDEVLLHDLNPLLSTETGDRIIVLHMLGSHGPSYYKRYPEAYRHFTPDCAQDEVQRCSRESIINAYDNTIVYTDHVLSLLIAALKQHQDQIEPSMIYLSDHGESLGENGLYLHGLPYALAPDEQKHVPLLVWDPQRDTDCLRSRSTQQLSQDNLFSTLLGLFTIQTQEYDAASDILQGCAIAKGTS